jgi:hypothetical protein
VKRLREKDKSAEEMNGGEGTTECDGGTLPDFIVLLSQAASKLPNVREIAKWEDMCGPVGMFICEFTHRSSVKRLREKDKSAEETKAGEGTMEGELRCLPDFIGAVSQAASKLSNAREMAKLDCTWASLWSSICEFTNRSSVKRLREKDKSEEGMNAGEGATDCDGATLPDFIVLLSQGTAKLPNVREIGKWEDMCGPVGMFICEFTHRFSVKRLREKDKSAEETKAGEGTMESEERGLHDFIVLLS